MPLRRQHELETKGNCLCINHIAWFDENKSKLIATNTARGILQWNVTKARADHNVHGNEYYAVRFVAGEYVCVGLDPNERYNIWVDLATTSLVYYGVSPRNSPLTVDMPPLYTVRGVVECPEQPRAEIARLLYDGDGSRQHSSAGRFAMANVPTGTFRVTFGVAGHSATTFPVTVTDHDVDLGTMRLTATGMGIITGRIVGGSG